MTKRIKILYVDSNLKSAGQVLKFFNPPQYLSKELNTQSDDPYQFVFIHCSTFPVALKNLAAYNIDPLAKARKLQPFDTIMFEVKKRVVSEKYSWINFLTDVGQLGLLSERLNLPYGLLAIGHQGGENIKDQLMKYGVRKLIKRPFELEGLKQELHEYFDTVFGSPQFYFEERKDEDTGITRRLIRYRNHAGAMSGIQLPYLQ